jgi:predicted  nucleic acid-binding Zn-ribbon protein
MALTKHCFKCGWVYTLDGSPARTESCHQCGTDLRICRNCAHYDRNVAHECRERRAEPVADKTSANFCEYFEFIRREWTGDGGVDAREQKAREDLKKLFGD